MESTTDGGGLTVIEPQESEDSFCEEDNIESLG